MAICSLFMPFLTLKAEAQAISCHSLLIQDGTTLSLKLFENEHAHFIKRVLQFFGRSYSSGRGTLQWISQGEVSREQIFYSELPELPHLETGRGSFKDDSKLATHDESQSFIITFDFTAGEEPFLNFSLNGKTYPVIDSEVILNPQLVFPVLSLLPHATHGPMRSDAAVHIAPHAYLTNKSTMTLIRRRPGPLLGIYQLITLDKDDRTNQLERISLYQTHVFGSEDLENEHGASIFTLIHSSTFR